MLWRIAISTVALGATLASSAAGYTFKTTDEGVPLTWPQGEVEYAIDGALARDLDDNRTLDAVHASFATWAEAPATALTMRYQGRADGMPLGYDAEHPEQNVNLITWSRDTWTHAPEALAVTISVYRSTTGELVDADIIVNEAHYSWGHGEGADNDLQNALTHEVGHLLGLGHAPEAPEATMYPSAAAGELEKRDLARDDLEAISTLYPGEGELPPPAPEAESPPPGTTPSTAPEGAPTPVSDAPSPEVGAPPSAVGGADGFTNDTTGCDASGGAPAGPSLLLLLIAAGALRRRRSS